MIPTRMAPTFDKRLLPERQREEGEPGENFPTPTLPIETVEDGEYEASVGSGIARILLFCVGMERKNACDDFRSAMFGT